MHKMSKNNKKESRASRREAQFTATLTFMFVALPLSVW